MKKLLVVGIMAVLGTVAMANEGEYHVKIKNGRNFEGKKIIVKGRVYDAERIVMNNITGSDTYRVSSKAFYAIESADESFIYNSSDKGKVIIPKDGKLVSKY